MFRAPNAEMRFDIAGVRGMNLIMRERKTGSRFQQATGECYEGPLQGEKLELYPFVVTTWKEWRRRHPETLALVPKAKFAKQFERAARAQERRRGGRPRRQPRRLLREDDRLPPYENVIGIEVAGAQKAYPIERLKAAGVVSDTIGGEPVVLIYDAATETATAYSRRLEGRVLSFSVLESAPPQLADKESGTVFNNYGEAVRGPLEGKQLETIVPLPSFWFSWAEFFPATEVYAGAGD